MKRTLLIAIQSLRLATLPDHKILMILKKRLSQPIWSLRLYPILLQAIPRQ